MSPAIAFISPLGRREFISDIYLHGKKTESGQNVFCVPAHGGHSCTNPDEQKNSRQERTLVPRSLQPLKQLHPQPASQTVWA